jgi:hypothetical protein
MRADIAINASGAIEISNYVRDLPPELARSATFVIDIGRSEDTRPIHETTVAGCESGACLLSDRSETP